MNILDKIIEAKKIEVAQRKTVRPIHQLERETFFSHKTLSLRDYLLREDKTGIIAEFKRKSPSKGIINDLASVTSVTKAYAAHGASGISVLTDQYFFGGTLDDLQAATINNVPLLRKDFIIDEYQLVESKAFGAEVILLIAACLTPTEVKRLSATARDLGLNVLLEIHNEEELGHIVPTVDVVGVNNRDLKTFITDINRSVTLSSLIPKDVIKISESGIDDIASIQLLKQYGFHGFLVGEKFMKEKDPGLAFENFVSALDNANKKPGNEN